MVNLSPTVSQNHQRIQTARSRLGPVSDPVSTSTCPRLDLRPGPETQTPLESIALEMTIKGRGDYAILQGWSSRTIHSNPSDMPDAHLFNFTLIPPALPSFSRQVSSIIRDVNKGLGKSLARQCLFSKVIRNEQMFKRPTPPAHSTPYRETVMTTWLDHQDGRCEHSGSRRNGHPGSRF